MTTEEATGRLNLYDDPSPLPETDNINILVDGVRKKTRGADVRESIAKALEVVYEDATKGGNTNMEVAKARGDFNFLSARLANIDARLDSKADAGKIATQLQNMASASPKGTYSDLASLKQAKPSGDTGTYITTNNKNWNYWNGSEWVSGGVYQASSVSPYDTFAFVAGNKPINFNNTNKTIEITGSNTYLLQGKVNVITKETIAYPTSSSWVVIDTITKKMKTATEPAATDIIVGAVFNPQQQKPHITFNGYFTIDNIIPVNPDDVATYSENIIYAPQGNIVYESTTKKLKYPRVNVKIGKQDNWIDANEVILNGASGFIVLDKAQRRIAPGDVIDTNFVLLGYYDNNTSRVFLNSFSIATKTKKIACLGDSITEGVNANGWQWHRYIDQWAKNNGIETTVVNLGIGGTSVCTSSYVTDTLKPFVNRLETIPTDADIVTIFGGTNDWGNNATLGTIDDTETSTFYGAYKHILEWIATNRPNAKVITMTPLKRYYRGSGTTWVNAQTTRNSKGNLLQDYARAVKEVSDLYAVPCVDLHNDSGLNPVLEIVRTKFMGDGLHPTAEGNKRMYPIILDKMRPLLEYD